MNLNLAILFLIIALIVSVLVHGYVTRPKQELRCGLVLKGIEGTCCQRWEDGRITYESKYYEGIRVKK
jgi:hypothetical protein